MITSLLLLHALYFANPVIRLRALQAEPAPHPTAQVEKLLADSMSPKLSRPERLQKLQDALDLAVKDKDRIGEERALNGLGDYFEDIGQAQKSIDLYMKALPIARETGDQLSEAGILDNIGNAYDDLVQEAKALDFTLQALALERKLKNQKRQASTLNNLAGIYARLGKPQSALESLSEAVTLLTGDNDRTAKAALLNNMGFLEDQLGQRAKSLESFHKALPIERELKDQVGEANTLDNIGAIYNDEGKFKLSLEAHERALPLRRASGDRRGEASTLGNIGGAYSQLRRYKEALKYLTETLAVAREVGERRVEANTLGAIGVTYNHMGEGRLAIEYFNQALPIMRATGDRTDEANTLNGAGWAYRRVGQQSRAIEFGKLSVKVYQSLRSDANGLAASLQRSFRDSVASRYRDLADWLAEAGRLAEAEQVLDLLKDDEFSSYTKRAGAKAEAVDLTPREAKWTTTYEELGDGLAAVGLEHETLANIPTANRTKDQKQRLLELEAKSDKAAAAFRVFLSQAEEAFSAAGADRNRVEDVKQSRDLQTTLKKLPNRPAALYTLVTGDGVRVIVSVPGLAAPRQGKSKVGSAALNKKILAFREALMDPTKDPRTLGAELYDLLVRPIEKDLIGAKTQTLMWSLDGTLRYIPMWALFDSRTQKYLIEKYPSSLFTPRTVDKLIDKPQMATGVEFGVTRGGIAQGFQFKPLHGVTKEVAGVKRWVLGPAPFLDDAFTYASLREALDSHPSIVHIASHFRFKPGDDAGSFLLLGKGETLSVAKLDGMSEGSLSSVDLLVLSACETALDGESDGREIEGFARVAQEKGAGAVIATLWEVADDSTSLLMTEFYRLRQVHSGWTKLKALQQAQLEMLRGTIGPGQSPAGPASKNPQVPAWHKGMPRFSHPYYWAPFVLTGNWR